MGPEITVISRNIDDLIWSKAAYGSSIVPNGHMESPGHLIIIEIGIRITAVIKTPHNPS